MAMTKKEQAEFETMRQMRDLALALRFRSEPLPQPMQLPEDHQELKVGWYGNSYTKEVSKGCFTKHNYSIDRKDMTKHSGREDFYNTRLDALFVMRNKVAMKAAIELANIDREIEKERNNPTPL